MSGVGHGVEEIREKWVRWVGREWVQCRMGVVRGGRISSCCAPLLWLPLSVDSSERIRLLFLSLTSFDTDPLGITVISSSLVGGSLSLIARVFVLSSACHGGVFFMEAASVSD